MENKISNLIGKNVITLDNGQEIGYVLNALFDEKLSSLEGFVVADEESERENLLPCKDVKIYGEDCLFVDSAADLGISFAVVNNPIGKKVYDESGILLGRVVDIEMDKFRVQNFLLEKCQIPAKAISVCGVDCLFFSKKVRKNRKKTQKMVAIEPNLLPKAKIESTLSQSGVRINQPVAQHKFEIPQKMVLTPANLVGRCATCDILGLNSEIIIKQGQKIDQNIIERAKKHGKINLLILNSK